MGVTPPVLFTALYACFFTISGVNGAYKYTDITYSSVSADKFKILNTEDSSSCEKYNAVAAYSSYPNNSVTCKCTSTNQLFYAASSNQVPKCSYENGGSLFGCPCTSSKCSQSFNQYTTLHVSWKLSNINCHYITTKWQIWKWNGRKFIPTSYESDFNLETAYNIFSHSSTVKLKWRSGMTSTRFQRYEGGLFRVKVICKASNTERCFIMKGEGTQTNVEIISPSSSADSGGISSAVVGGGVLASVGVVIIIVICCWKIKCGGNQQIRQVVQQAIVQQAVVQQTQQQHQKPTVPAYEVSDCEKYNYTNPTFITLPDSQGLPPPPYYPQQQHPPPPLQQTGFPTAGGIQSHPSTNVDGFQPGQAPQVLSTGLVHQQPMFPGGDNGGTAPPQLSDAPVAHPQSVVADSQIDLKV